jgi:hypothetical protein
MLTDHELLAAVRSSSAMNDPAVRELARRFAEDVAAMDANEAAFLEQPQPLSLDITPRPVAYCGGAPAATLPRLTRLARGPFVCLHFEPTKMHA